MNPLYRQAIVQSVFGTALFIALIFWPAGTFQYWQGWLFFAVFATATTGFTIYLAILRQAALLSVGSRRGRSMSRRGRRRPSCRLPLSHFCNHRITCARSPLWLVACSAMGFYFRRCDYLAFVPLY